MSSQENVLRENLRGWLESQWAVSFGASDELLALELFEKLSNGQSSTLYRVRCRQGQHAVEYVVRLEPRDKQLFLHPDVMREAQTLRALSAYPRIPTPKIWWTESDDRVLGAPFLVMSWVEGRVPLGRPSMHVTGLLPTLQPEDRAVLWASAMDALVAIHSVDWRETHSFLVPAGGPSRYFSAHLRKINEWYAWTVRGRKYPFTDAALDYLNRHEKNVDDGEAVLVWNDARVGNMLFGIDNRVAAVIDWELPIIGPPGIDIGYWMMMDEFHAEAIGVPRLCGWPSESETLARYQMLSGQTIEPIDYFVLLAALFIATTLIRQSDLGVEAGRLAPDNQMGHANSATQIIARLLGMPRPPLCREFILHRRLDTLKHLGPHE
jgi:aminoglycoside phosphotransferase (APT) family kinase protein